MNAPPRMRPWQNALAIFATWLCAGALLPLGTRIRLTCAAGAFAAIGVLLVSRLRAHARSRDVRSIAATQTRIDRIRAARESRLGRTRR
jgi:hypothetical protein